VCLGRTEKLPNLHVSRYNFTNRRDGEAAVSALAVCLDPHRLMREALRHLRIIAGVLIVVVALHQIGSELVSCLMGLSPDPIACNQPEVALPDTDNEGPALGQVLDKAPFAIVTSATSVTPCFNPGPKHSPR
jgi:hypothetical protein